MTDAKNYKNYSFQDTLSDLALAGHDIIVQAPTGAGKTRGAMLPALKGFERSIPDYPQRMVYGVPLRVLASSFASEFEQTARKNKKWLDQGWKPTIQTGERPEDNLFEGKLIFATVDQILASFLNIPYGISRRLDNINAGALIGSYLIFDEFHLYPSSQMMLTVLAMLKMLKGISRFTLMTATFSRNLLNALGDELGAEIIAEDPNTPVQNGIFKDIPILNNQNRTWSAHDEVLTGQHIQNALRDYRTVLCVCNRVDRAQAVYRELMSTGIPDDTDCLLLHSRFYQQHRKEKEDRGREWLGTKDNVLDDGRRKVIIATQVIEVGLDISADVLLTECAPAASLIQRAGRCARWGGTGFVRVFQPPADDNGPNYAPYLDDGLKDVCEKTWDALTASEFGDGGGAVLHYHDEQHLIDIAHSEHDCEHIVNGLENKIETRIGQILDCMRRRETGLSSELIRENKSVSLYIMGDREDKRLTEQHYKLEAFSVSQGQIYHAFATMEDNNVDAEYCFAAGTEAPTEQDGDDFQTKIRYQWHPLHDKQQVFGNYLFVAHPDAVAYDDVYGLEWLNTGHPALESPESKGKAYQPINYDPDTYVEHIEGLLKAYQSKVSAKGYHQSLRDEYQYALLQTARALNVDIDWPTLDRYLCLTIALHDVGKLNRPWQRWAQTRHQLFAQYYPDAAIKVPVDGTPLAHTAKGARKFSTPDEEKAFDAEFRAAFKGKRGNHAVESAEATRKIIWQAVNQDPFWYGVISAAICHHHTPTADRVRDRFDLVDNGREAIAETLKRCGFESEAQVWAGLVQQDFKRVSSRLKNSFDTVKPSRGSYRAAIIYYLFVRILRLADQRSSDYIHS